MTRASLVLLVALAAAGCAKGGSNDSGSTPSSPSPTPSAANISGTWRGSATDSSGPGQVVWVITQSGSAISGSITMTDTSSGISGRGTVGGSLSGSSLHFTIDFPAGGLDSPEQACSATAAGDGQVSATSITGTYTGNNSCHGLISGGQLTLTKQ